MLSFNYTLQKMQRFLKVFQNKKLELKEGPFVLDFLFLKETFLLGFHIKLMQNEEMSMVQHFMVQSTRQV